MLLTILIPTAKTTMKPLVHISLLDSCSIHTPCPRCDLTKEKKKLPNLVKPPSPPPPHPPHTQTLSAYPIADLLLNRVANDVQWFLAQAQ